MEGTDIQFKALIRMLLYALRGAQAEPDMGRQMNKLQKITDILQSVLED